MKILELSKELIKKIPKDYNLVNIPLKETLFLFASNLSFTLNVRVNDTREVKFPRISISKFYESHPLFIEKEDFVLFVKTPKNESSILRQIKSLINDYKGWQLETISNPWKVNINNKESILFVREDLNILVFKTTLTPEETNKFKEYLRRSIN